MSPDLTPDAFSERLTIAMDLRKLSSAGLADQSGIHATQISHYVIGTRLPSARNVVRLARALDVSADVLLGLDGLTLDRVWLPSRLVMLLDTAAQLPHAQLAVLLGIAALLAEKKEEAPPC